MDGGNGGGTGPAEGGEEEGDDDDDDDPANGKGRAFLPGFCPPSGFPLPFFSSLPASRTTTRETKNSKKKGKKV